MRWMTEVATTGRWWDPAFWRHPAYRAESLLDAEQLEAAFAALQKLYPEKDTRAAFAWALEEVPKRPKDLEEPRAPKGPKDPKKRERLMQGIIWRILSCPFRPDLSGLVRLGLDAVDADLFAQPELVRKLREDIPREFKGARFELRCLAALRNAGIVTDYEPLSGAGTGRNPDFRLRLPGQLYVDAKHVEEGDGIKEETRWWLQLGMPDEVAMYADDLDALMNDPPATAHVRLTEKYRQLQESTSGRSYLRTNIRRLSEQIERTKRRLAASGGPFPAVEVIEGLIEVAVEIPESGQGGMNMTGSSTDTTKEVGRIVRGAVTTGAAQIPPGELGLVLLDPESYAPIELLVEELKRWMAAPGEGAEYPNLVGVLAISPVRLTLEDGVDGMVETIVPIWRDGAPQWVIDGPWEQFSNAFAQWDLKALVGRSAFSSRSTPAT